MRSFAAHEASAAVAGAPVGADRRRPRTVRRRTHPVHALRTAGGLTRRGKRRPGAAVFSSYLLTASRTPRPTKTAPAARFSATPADARPRRRALIADADT